MEFVGIHVTDNGNCPAKSKHNLLWTWPLPETVCDVASFVCFCLFYSKWIPNFEIRALPLPAIMLRPFTEKNTNCLDQNTEAYAAWLDLKHAIFNNPCLAQFDQHNHTYLCTDFLQVGFGYVILQPGNDQHSLDAMECEMNWGKCKFMCKGSDMSLRPIAFGCPWSKGYEDFLHSHLGGGFAGDWKINKNHQFASPWNSHGLQIALASPLSFLMMAIMKLFVVYKCNQCFGK